jgi:hypothetical protein
MAHTTPESGAQPAPRGEQTFDLDVSYMGWFSIGIMLLVIVTALSAYAMLGGFRIPLPRPASVAVPNTQESAAVPFATLQSTPQVDLRSYRLAQANALESYRWIDRAGGIVQIPIERAMELVATEGNTRAVPAAAPSTGAKTR